MFFGSFARNILVNRCSTKARRAIIIMYFEFDLFSEVVTLSFSIQLNDWMRMLNVHVALFIGELKELLN